MKILDLIMAADAKLPPAPWEELDVGYGEDFEVLLKDGTTAIFYWSGSRSLVDVRNALPALIELVKAAQHYTEQSPGEFSKLEAALEPLEDV